MVLEMRYIPCYALQVEGNYIPYWKLDYSYEEDYGHGYKAKDNYRTTYGDLTECFYDLVEKKIVLGIVKDIYEKPKYQVGQQVLVDSHNSTYRLDVIKEIVYEKYESSCRKAKDLDEYQLSWYFTKDEIKDIKFNELYEFRRWEPYYLLESGKLIKYNHQLAQLIKD